MYNKKYKRRDGFISPCSCSTNLDNTLLLSESFTQGILFTRYGLHTIEKGRYKSLLIKAYSRHLKTDCRALKNDKKEGSQFPVIFR